MPREKEEQRRTEPLSQEALGALSGMYQVNSRWLDEHDDDFIPGTPSYDRKIRARAENGIISRVLIDSRRPDLLTVRDSRPSRPLTQR